MVLTLGWLAYDRTVVTASGTEATVAADSVASSPVAVDTFVESAPSTTVVIDPPRASELAVGSSAREFEWLIPNDWTVTTAVRGDLDGDDSDEIAFVAERSGGAAAGESPRVVGIVRTNARFDEPLQIEALDSTLVALDAGNEPLRLTVSLTVTNGVLRVNTDAWFAAETMRLTRSWVFRFQSGCNQLIGYDASETVNRSESDSTVTKLSYNLSTGELVMTTAAGVQNSTLPVRTKPCFGSTQRWTPPAFPTGGDDQ
jgi:hypothetical protein